MGEGEGGMIWENGIETCILLYVKQNASPGSMHDTGCSGWCTGMTQRDGMGREVGGGFRMGNTCTPVADSWWCMAKLIQKKKNKTKSLQQLPTDLFYTWQCIYVSPNLPIHPTHSFSHCVHTYPFSMLLSLFLPQILVLRYHFSTFHIYTLICDICFSRSYFTL